MYMYMYVYTGWSQLQQEIVTKNELIRQIEAENLQLQQQLKDKRYMHIELVILANFGSFSSVSKIDPTLTEKFKNFCISAKRFIE